MPSPLDHAEKCVFLVEKIPIKDGMGGYVHDGWIEGTEFEALIGFNSSLQARLAEQQNFGRLYTVYVNRELDIKLFDVFRRIEDGQAFRVTSNPNDQRAPVGSTFDFKVFSAEKYILPDKL